MKLKTRIWRKFSQRPVNDIRRTGTQIDHDNVQHKLLYLIEILTPGMAEQCSFW
jgi:hypothetical protein